tara:strand:- start:966 stop:1163 length:198 start_codon:yes stop_codon:yes gene_type:complete
LKESRRASVTLERKAAQYTFSLLSKLRLIPKSARRTFPWERNKEEINIRDEIEEKKKCIHTLLSG